MGWAHSAGIPQLADTAVAAVVPLPVCPVCRYAHTVEGLLGVAPLRSLMVSLPAAVEAWRERLTLKAGFFRTLRQAKHPPVVGCLPARLPACCCGRRDDCALWPVAAAAALGLFHTCAGAQQPCPPACLPRAAGT